MAFFRLTDLAENDFDDIGLYTLNEWGFLQAEKYQRELDACFQKLTENTTMGRKRRDLQLDVLCHPCNKHIIFFRRDPSGNVEILLILHERMDFGTHV